MDKDEEIAALRTEIELLKEQFLSARHISNPCTKCMGFGKIYYGNSATWRILDSAMLSSAVVTLDVCNECWGSGDIDNPFTNLLELEKTKVNLARLDQFISNNGWKLIDESSLNDGDFYQVLLKTRNAIITCRFWTNRFTCSLKDGETISFPIEEVSYIRTTSDARRSSSFDERMSGL